MAFTVIYYACVLYPAPLRDGTYQRAVALTRIWRPFHDLGDVAPEVG